METGENLNIPDRLKCSVCHAVLKTPLQHACGDRFCAECAESLVGEARSCPCCDEAMLKETLFPDAAARREIEQMRQNSAAWSAVEPQSQSSSSATVATGPNLNVVQSRLDSLLDAIRNLSTNMAGLQGDVSAIFRWKNEFFGAINGTDQMADMFSRIVSLEDRVNAGNGASADDMGRKVANIERMLSSMESSVRKMNQQPELNQDDLLMWTIHNYQRRKQEAVEGTNMFINSPPFYSHRYGYKMCLRVYLHGDDDARGKHLSVYFILMNGEYDNVLEFPVSLRITITLLDQQARRNNRTVSREADCLQLPTVTVRESSFVLLSDVESLPYCLGDAIYLKVTVERLRAQTREDVVDRPDDEQDEHHVCHDSP